MPARHVTVAIPEGLHARPAALFVRLAAEQPVAVTVRRADASVPVPASSILSVMALGAHAGDELVLEADGDGADDALTALADYLASQG